MGEVKKQDSDRYETRDPDRIVDKLHTQDTVKYASVGKKAIEVPGLSERQEERLRFWREQCELREKALVERDAELKVERRARLELQREYAVMVIDVAKLLHRRPEHIDPEGSCKGVQALVNAHWNTHIGTCDRCGKRAPLRDAGTVRTDPSGTQHVCAWSCEVET